MKKTRALIVAVLLLAAAAHGQSQRIVLCTELSSCPCESVDNRVALVSIYVVHLYSPGAVASSWMVAQSPDFNCSYVGEAAPWATVIGNTRTGIWISYGLCVVGDALLITINYFCQGLTPACEFLEVVPNPAATTGEIEVVDCSFVTVAGVGGVLIVNNDGSCPCYRPTTVTSWGQVKVLFE